MSKGNSICIKVYLKPALFAEMAQEAEKAGIRRRGLLLFIQKEHGFAHEKLANTDKLAKFMKFCFKYYKENESKRIAEAAEAMKAKEAAEKKLKELGHGL